MEGTKSALVKWAIALIAVTYAGAITGLYAEGTKSLLQKMIPYHVLFSTAILLYFHIRWTRKALMAMTLAILAGFLIDIIEVKTGKIFGAYQYGSSIGLNIFSTPLVAGIAGINWLMLIYVTHVAVRKIGIVAPWIELTGAALVTAMVCLMEPAAMKYGFRQWPNDVIPLQNYIAWFYLSFFMHYYFNRVKPVQENVIAVPLLAILFLFFLILNVF